MIIIVIIASVGSLAPWHAHRQSPKARDQLEIEVQATQRCTVKTWVCTTARNPCSGAQDRQEQPAGDSASAFLGHRPPPSRSEEDSRHWRASCCVVRPSARRAEAQESVRLRPASQSSELKLSRSQAWCAGGAGRPRPARPQRVALVPGAAAVDSPRRAEAQLSSVQLCSAQPLQLGRAPRWAGACQSSCDHGRMAEAGGASRARARGVCCIGTGAASARSRRPRETPSAAPLSATSISTASFGSSNAAKLEHAGRLSGHGARRRGHTTSTPRRCRVCGCLSGVEGSLCALGAQRLQGSKEPQPPVVEKASR